MQVLIKPAEINGHYKLEIDGRDICSGEFRDMVELYERIASRAECRIYAYDPLRPDAVPNGCSLEDCLNCINSKRT